LKIVEEGGNNRRVFFPGNVNKLKMKNRGFILLLYLFFVIQASAQVFTNKEVGQKNAGLIDSLWPASHAASKYVVFTGGE